jgi:hypothetical protein
MNLKTGSRLAFSTICLLLLSSCVTLNDPEASQEYRSHSIAEITPDQDFGQTFVSRRPKLNRVQAWLQVPQQDVELDFQLVASLYHKPSDSEPLATITIEKKDLEKSFPLSINFPIQANRPDESYFLRIKTSGGKVIVYGRDENQYASGEAWINDTPQVSDAAFRLGYYYNLIDFFIDNLKQPQIILYLLCITWFSWMPGRLCLLLTGFDKRYDWGERTALSIGISLAFYPIIFIWSSLANFTWDQARIWGLLGLLTVGYLVLVIRQVKPNKIIRPKMPSNWWISFGLVSIFLASLSIRLVMVRDLSAPAWVDSVHHALLGKLVVMNGGIPESYTPFVDIGTSNYHPGFHVTLAIFQWLSQLDISMALLLLGQVINAFMVFSTYLFTTTLVKNQSAGLVAAFFTGLVTPMPAYYTSWGRYTQLAGLVILPAAIAIVYPFLEDNTRQLTSIISYLKKRESLANISLITILLAGLFLTHYRVFAFEITLISVISIFAFYSWYKEKILKFKFIHYFFVFLSVSLLSIIILIPWLPDTIRTLFVPSLVWSQSAPAKLFGDFSWNLLTSARGIYSLVIAMVGFLWAIIQRKVFAWILGAWLVLLFVFANLNVWSLPGSNFINNTSVVISLFLPISVFCGFIISWLLTGWHHLIPGKFNYFYIAGVIVASFVLAWITSKPLITILNPTTLIFREIDRPALAWIKEHIPSEEVILINPFSWGYGLYAGNDGGFWISPLSERVTLPPPVLYGLDLINMREINIMCNKIIRTNGDPQILYEEMVENQINYIYIGAKGGLLSPTKIQQSQYFQVLYHNQTTWFFKTK